MQQNFFDKNIDDTMKREAPLSVRMRPHSLEEFFGQDHLVGIGKLLYRSIQADKITSLILYGPPGTGKTTLAKIIAHKTKSIFSQINAVTSGIKDIREVIDKARENLGLYNKRTILFIDEIHRFNKSQQDALLPAVEEGIVVLIGATTENPYFEVNSPLISRSRVFQLNKLSVKDIQHIIENALKDKTRGLGSLPVEITTSGIEQLSLLSEGDARSALNALELAVLTTTQDENGKILITTEIIEECIQKKAVYYDKKGDNHYDTISAFIKSIRGSDPDGAIYWMAKMIAGGEDPKFIARRLVISASEDIGNADPQALTIAVAAFKAVEIIGLPEARINLAQAVTYLASAPKSNASYTAIDKALDDVTTKRLGDVPIHLKDSHYKGAKELGNGKGYKYPHSYEGNYTKQDYLPEKMVNIKYYEPTENGYEKKIKERLSKLK
ncbi:AAA family ATPase [Alkalibaculum sp. M08DMB]|uniref:Replication-associated recombination protein A n=1 Tax=Alkalibaculum sporogenes TaxID=2655001 RepID=A0A6A7KA18_9FIRM|nr:replication-associated recombination protein A [Alkalibaculum sporogenes]MPW26320.1 AAA family ATPase [Alkalibaculum sporogenes]